MDFMKILRSLEELLYEVMTWLVFYPRTLFQTLFQPMKTLEYCRAQVGRPEEEQFDEALSPPLFLLLTLLLSHALELSLNIDPVQAAKGPITQLSQQNLILLRSLVFAVFPLMFALRYVRASGQPLSRSTLRGPFFIECYPAAAFTLLLQAGLTIATALPQYHLVGGLVSIAATVWYLGLQTAWISRTDKRRWRGLGLAVWQGMKATAVIALIALIIGAAGLVVD
jgi:hypothetical protein